MFKNLKKTIKRAIIFILVLGSVVVVVITLTNLYGDKIFAKKTISLWIDSDSWNQVDNLFAITRAVIDPKVEVVGLSSVQREVLPKGNGKSMDYSQQLNDSLLRLFQKSFIPHPPGASEMMRFTNNPIPVKSAAAEQIISMAKKFSKREKLKLVCLGPLTNIASAVLSDPEIIPLVSVYFNSMHYNPKTKVWNKNEAISRNDLDALDIVLNTEGLETFVLPVSASSGMLISSNEIDKYIAGKEGIWKLLYTEWNAQSPGNSQLSMDALALIEGIIDPELAKLEQRLSPPENRQRTVNIYTYINQELMIADFWSEVNKFNRKADASD